MKRFADIFLKIYYRSVLGHPVWVLVILMLILAFLGYKAKDFRIDASAETLLLEDDSDLRYTREINERYGQEEFLLIAYTPKDGDLLSNETLANLRNLRNELKALEDVTSVLTILDVPLLESPPLSYKEFSETVRTLESPDVDKEMARTELKESYFYRDLLVSPDMTTTALVIYLKPDEQYRQLAQQRNDLLGKRATEGLTEDQQEELDRINRQIDRILERINARQHRHIKAIRSIMDHYRQDARLYLGGISMIANDMIAFIRSDLRTFGVGVFVMLIVMLGIIFKRVRWIVLPMLCCFISVTAMMGILGAFGWEVTVISSNFISLQLIITLAIVVHLIVRYRELQKKNPTGDRRTLVHDTVRSKWVPCLYAALTTIAGFGSLLLSNIKPVIHFGWMMSAGIVLSLLLTFILFPAVLMLLKKPEPPSRSILTRFSLTRYLADFTQKRGTAILVTTAVVSILTIIGTTRLEVENSFIDYFKQSTEIYQGMKTIDQKLGGTTPLDVIVQFEDIPTDTDFMQDELEPDPFADVLQTDENQYWFTDHRLQVVQQVHDYLQHLPQTGKILSLGTLIKIAGKLNKGQNLDSLEMAVLYKKLPDELKEIILDPYVSFDQNEARFSVRIKDSLKDLKRDALLKQIRYDLTHDLGLKEDQVHLAGTMVLYNNMLQSLFSSQIKTLGVVALALLGMFLLLFRSLKVGLIALFPNLFASGLVLAIMGYLDIPLDMMTITIAAISIGIAVDDTIHYIYRFKREIQVDGDYLKTMHRCHGSIGHAMYYTSLIIITGFSILVLSKFWPTIYFGLFTGLAMLVALIAALTLLPQLIVLFKPFGPDNGKNQ